MEGMSRQVWLQDPSFQSKLASLRAFRIETGHSCQPTEMAPRAVDVGFTYPLPQTTLPSEVVEVLVAEGVVFDAKEARTVRGTAPRAATCATWATFARS